MSSAVEPNRSAPFKGVASRGQSIAQRVPRAQALQGRGGGEQLLDKVRACHGWS